MKGPKGKTKHNICGPCTPTSHPRMDYSKVCRTLRSHTSIFHLEGLPPEMLLHVCKFLDLPDLLNMLQLNKPLKKLLESTPKIWANVSLAGLWPCTETMKIFKRIAAVGNKEASIKLAQALLYKEGVVEATSLENYDTLIGEFLTLAECNKATSLPFTWLFIRPPWSTNGLCRKAKTFQRWKEQYLKDQDTSPAVLFSMAKVESYMEEPDSTKVSEWLQEAASQGLVQAKYLVWKDRVSSEPHDAARSLEAIRQLREIASLNCLEAQLHLYTEYAKGNHGHLSTYLVSSSFRTFIQSSPWGLDYSSIFRLQQGFTPSMRYILVDWLVEVATLKEFSSDTIHLTVQCVDRYLSVCSIPRTKLQLIGITSMLVCARLVEDNIVTIREAAWLTDGTYKYEEVVRMMGEVVATLKGNIKHVTVLDYLRLLCNLVPTSQKCQYVAQYITELSLLYSDFGHFKVSEIAASSILLARIMMNEEAPWPQHLMEFSGFTLKDLTKCCLALHRKCFMESPLTDHRDVILTAVKQRYSEDAFLKASNVPIKSLSEMQAALCVETDERYRRRVFGSCTPSNGKKKEEQFLLLSPSRKSRKRTRVVYVDYDTDTDDIPERPATPTQELANQETENINQDAVDEKLSDKCCQDKDAPQSPSNLSPNEDASDKCKGSLNPRRAKLQDIKNLQNVNLALRSSPRSLKRKSMES